MKKILIAGIILSVLFCASYALAQEEYTFVTKWGSSCWLVHPEGCVDPDGPGPLELGDGQLRWPTGVAVDSSGNVYVAEVYNNRIQKFNSDGVFITKWGAGYAYGVAVDSSGDVYVSIDSGWAQNRRIQRFTSDGGSITKWTVVEPRAVAVDSSGNNVYMTYRANYSVNKYSTTDGITYTFVTKFGGYGTGDGQFCSYIRGVAVDSEGYVYVADTGNGRIQKFTSDGVFITKWGLIDRPNAVAVDSSGNVYVVHESGWYQYSVSKYSTTDGITYTFVTKFGSGGTGDGQFFFPSGVAVDSSGNVYVSDSGNHRIQKFCKNQAPIADAGPDRTVEQTSYDGASVTLDGSGSSDPEGDPLTYSWTWDGESASGVDPAVLLPRGVTTITLAVSDGQLSDTDTVDVTVQDTIPPKISIYAPELHGLYPVGDLAMDFSATDATSEPTLLAMLYRGDEEWPVLPGHIVSDAGVYTLGVSAWDDTGNAVFSEPVFFVVYDPEGGFVTGGGWIDSPESAYVPDPSLTGKANFGFVSKYNKGADTHRC